MKAPLIPEEILAFFVLSNLNKNYSIKQFLKDRERARSKFRMSTPDSSKAKSHRKISKGAIREKEI